MGRKRLKDRHLPPRVYLRRGSYFYVDPKGTWHNVGRTLASMYAQLANRSAPSAAGCTMSEVFNRYQVERLPKLAARTQSDYLTYLVNLRGVFDSAPPREVTPGHVSDYVLKRAERSVVQANREKSCLSAVFTAAVQWHFVDSNPCRAVPKLPEPSRDRYVTDAEYSAVFKLASPMMQVAMELATLTGQREGDLLTLRRSQLIDEGIVFELGKSKRRHPRHGRVVESAKRLVVEWSPELREVVERAKKLGPDIRATLICTLDGKPFTSSGFRSNWHRLLTKATKPDAHGQTALGAWFTFHDLRAKSASDAELEDAVERLGHSDVRTTQSIYRRKPRRARPGQRILDTG